MIVTQRTAPMEGYIWYYKKIYSGTKQEYLEFCQEFKNVELIMKLQVSSTEELKKVADNLNKSNFLQALRDRFGTDNWLLFLCSARTVVR